MFPDLAPIFLRRPGTASDTPYINSPNPASSSDVNNFLAFPTSPEHNDFSSFFNDLSALPMFDDSNGQPKSEPLYDDLFGDFSNDGAGTASDYSFNYNNDVVAPDAISPSDQVFHDPLISPATSDSFSPLVSPAPSLFNTSPELGSPLPAFDMFGTDGQSSPTFLDTLLNVAPAAEAALSSITRQSSAPAPSAVNADMKKLEILRAYAQQPKIRAQLPALLPAIERLAARLQTSSTATKPTAIRPTATNAPAASLPSPDMEMEDPPKRRVGRKRKPRPTDPAIIAAEALAKRQKNTEAARRSRLRKMMKMESMEEELKKVVAERDALKEKVKALEEKLSRR